MPKSWNDYMVELFALAFKMCNVLAKKGEEGVALVKAIINERPAVALQPFIPDGEAVHGAAFVGDRLALLCTIKGKKYLVVETDQSLGQGNGFKSWRVSTAHVPIMVAGGRETSPFFVYMDGDKGLWHLRSWYCSDPIETAETEDGLVEKFCGEKRHRCDWDCAGKYCAPIDEIKKALKEGLFFSKELWSGDDSRPILLQHGCRTVRIFTAPGGIYTQWF